MFCCIVCVPSVCVFCILVLFLLMCIVVSFLFMYMFTDYCHRVETQMQLINVYIIH
jgi:CHASE3 domain sensor protein